MATYAAFKHVEIYNVGSGKKRVLKPPGGSSTDIFGTTDLQSTPRSIKNHMKSNIFAAPAPLNKAAMAPAGEVVRRVPVDSHNRLFGTPERDNTAKKSQQGSIVSLGNGDERDAPWKQTNGNGYSKRHINGGGTNGNSFFNGYENSVGKDRNPVTGEGFKQASEINSQVPSLGHQVVNKNRIPPGGFSSGLW